MVESDSPSRAFAMTLDSSDTPRPLYLEAAAGVSIAYHKTSGKSPMVVFCGGFMSDMTGTKAMALEKWAKSRGQAYLRFDYRGHGASSGHFEDCTVGMWADDARTVVDRLGVGSQVLVGSSMGGWIALLTALARPSSVAGLMLIAPAVDFTGDLMWDQLSAEAREMLRRDGVWRRPSAYSAAPYPITMKLIEDGKRHFLMTAPIDFTGPVRILHGMEDPDVPWLRSLALADRLVTRDLRLTFVKDGEHRLSRPQDLALLCGAVEELCDSVA
jgi:pimeloyl-ACP methyl ester carboxylesterase